MLQPRRALHCCLAILFISGFVGYVRCKTEISQNDAAEEEGIQINQNIQRVKRNADVTTVFVVPNSDEQDREGRHINKVVGVLTSTARTFVHDGTTTEFATQVVGTTLDNGRLYARLLSTSSRVFYVPKTREPNDVQLLPSIAHVPDFDVRPTVVRPHVVYPSKPQRVDRFPSSNILPFEYVKPDSSRKNVFNDDDNQSYSSNDDKVVKVFAITDHPTENVNYHKTTASTERVSNKIPGDDIEAVLERSKAYKKFGNQYAEVTEEEKQNLENLVKSKRMDYFGDVDGNEVNPVRVIKPGHGLPTYTIRHEFAPSGFSFEDYVEGTTETKKKDNAAKNNFRSGKALFRGGVANNLKKLDTVTYFGFADFTTTVGDTVILFMPSTRQPSLTGKTIKATSVPGEIVSSSVRGRNDEQESFSVVTSVKTFMSHTPGMVTRTVTGHSLTMETALPTTIVLPETPSVRHYKALESVHFIDAVSPSYEETTPSFDIRPSKTVTIQRSSTTYIDESMPFDMTSSFLAHEQQAFKSSSLATESELRSSIILEPSVKIEPSSVTTEYSSSVEPTESLPELSSLVEGRSTEFLDTPTTPLWTLDTTRTQTIDHGSNQQPTGLIKALAGTRAANGTTTLFTSLIYGTYIGNSYAQIIHSTSNVFFFVEETKSPATETNVKPTAVVDSSEPSSSIAAAEDVTYNEITTNDNAVTTDGTTEQSTDNKILTTVDDEALSTVPMETTTDSGDDDAINEVETARKVNVNSKNQIIVPGNDVKVSDKNNLPVDVKPSPIKDSISKISSNQNVLTQYVPTTVYKTLTYLTTFFIPAGESSSLTTSVNSREVITSEVAFVTKLVTLPIADEMTKTASLDIAPSSSTFSLQTSAMQETTPVTEPRSFTTTDAVEKTTQESVTEGDTTTFIVTTPASVDTTSEGKISNDNADAENEEEIELILKTLYTTYTYFTTFFQESTSSVTSSESVVTNIITTTVDKDTILEATDPALAGLFGKSETSGIQPFPTSIGVGRPTSMYVPDADVNPDTDLFSSVIDSVDVDKELSSPTPALQSVDENAVQTFYKTYTYFTTILVDGETTLTSRTEVYTNYITPSGLLIKPTTVSQNVPHTSLTKPSSDLYDQLEAPQSYYTQVLQNAGDYVPLRSLSFKSAPRNTYSSTISRNRQKSSVDSTAILSSSLVEDDEDNKIFASNTPQLDKAYLYSTISSRLRQYENTDAVTSPKSPISSRDIPEQQNSRTYQDAFVKEFGAEMMSTDITSSSSGSDLTPKLDKNDKFEIIDDQISSESNTEEIQPSATLALVTSYTTFTYFTTLYKTNASSDVISRLETVTNVVTETITPRQSLSPSEILYQEFPLTEFTTFTYWTTLYRGGSSTITSREETVTNIIPATAIEQPQVINVTPLEITPSPTILEPLQSSTTQASILLETFTIGDNSEDVNPTTSKPTEEVNVLPTTEYTTFTYFTTSYIGDSTVVNSRLETVTSIVNNTISVSDIQSGRAVGTVPPSQQILVDGIDKISSTATSTQELYPTGLLSTILASEVNNGTTTLFSTDVFGTYIDGKYANVLESSTMVIRPTPVPSPVQNSNLLPTGVVSLNEGKIVDADGVTTTYFTTKAIGTYIADLYAQVVETTSSVQIDPDKTATISATESESQPFKTGLVRLIEGSIVQDHTTTFYESKVVGTIIDGRYAQIIESTSSFKADVASTSVSGIPNIASTSVLSSGQVVPPSSITTTPSPVVIESSISDSAPEKEHDNKDESEEEKSDEDEDEDDNQSNSGKGRVKSRLTFSTRKKTFTPVIRPFVGIARTRPAFNPRKTISPASSATTITRTTFTPTITASPAAKTDRTGGSSRGRFSNNRRQSSANEIQPTPTSSRRFSRTRGGSSSSSYHSTSGSGRGRSSTPGRIHATSSLGSSRRGAFRSSSTRPGGSSSIYPGGSSSKYRIRPTASIGRGQSPTAGYTTPSTPETLGPDDNDLTTLMTEETALFTDDNDDDTPTQSLSTTTESLRRNNNPLLRFRRPPGLRAPQSQTTSRPSTTSNPKKTSQIRKSQNNRITTTTSKPTSRSANSITSRYKPINNRQRPPNNLFPPRSLFRRPGQDDDTEEKETKDDERDEINEEENNQNDNRTDGDEIEEDEFEDNDYEGSERAESKTNANRRSGTAYNTVQIRPFRRSRVKRQAEYGTRNAPQRSTRSYTSRFRRPSSRTTTPQAQDRIDSVEEATSETPKVKHSSTNRFTPKSRYQSFEQPQQTQTQQKVRPTPSTTYSGRSQFTLREKDTTTATRANFKRPSTTTSSSRRRSSNTRQETTTVPQRPKAPRLRTQQTNTHSDATTYSRSNGRRYNTNTNTNRGRNPGRTRFRDSTDLDTYTYSQSSFDGTITVTHRVPTEVTIPIVNGKITEYRNVITASPSTEVLGPHQYTLTTGKSGNTLFQLTSEVTGTLPNGLTEITQFILRNTPTTSIIFTPTVIRGRKTSFSHIIPSTVYDVEAVVSTVQPQISPNAPLANILLSQLLLGNIGLQPNINPLLAITNNASPASPTTEYKTRTTTYVTTVTKGTSTIIPLTFRGKEILTTIVDSSLEVITATEFLTDTIVVTPTAAANNQLNSLLIPALLQAQLLNNQPSQQPNINSLFGSTQQPGELLEQQKFLTEDLIIDDEITRRFQTQRQRNKPEDADRSVRDSERDILDDDFFQSNEDDDDINISAKQSRKKVSKNGAKKPPDILTAETSVVTLYVSGRRPGEFSTVLSTVTLGDDSTIRKREAEFIVPETIKVVPSQVPQLGGSFPQDDDYIDKYLMPALNEVSVESSEVETQSLESIVGDVSSYVSNVHSIPNSKKAEASQTKSKELPSKIKNIESSYSNIDRNAGHFLSKGPAELTPLKRKVDRQINWGNNSKTESCEISRYLGESSNKCSEVLPRKIRDISSQLDENESSLRNPAHRRRIRVKVPIRRNKSQESQEEKDIFSLSEAQRNERVPNLGINTDVKYSKDKTDTSSSIDFGSRKVKVLRNKRPINTDQDVQQTTNDHLRKRIVVARRKRPIHSKDSESFEENSSKQNLGLADSDYSPESDRLYDLEYSSERNTEEQTSSQPEEDQVTKSSEKEINQKSTESPARKRIRVTRKRPLPAPTTSESHSRRRVVVTRRRPAHKDEDHHDVSTTVMSIPESMSTLYSYKYTVINDDDDEKFHKMTRVSQVFMSGEIPTHLHQTTEDVSKIDVFTSVKPTKVYKTKSYSEGKTTAVHPSFSSSNLRSENQNVKSKVTDVEEHQSASDLPDLVSTDLGATETPEIVTLPEDQFFKIDGDVTVESKQEVMTDSPEKSQPTTEENKIPVTTPEDTESVTNEGPKFIRPTRFSITRKPERTRPSFAGQRRRTSSLSSSTTTSVQPTPSSSHRPSYRTRRPSSSSSPRSFSRNSKQHRYSTPHETRKQSEQVSPTYTVAWKDELTPTIDSSLNDETSSVAPSLTATPTLFTELVTSTRLRTFTFIVTRASGDEIEVTSTTEVKPHVTTLTVTRTFIPSEILRTESRIDLDEGRALNMMNVNEARYNLATKVMSNGVEVIVAQDKTTRPGEPEILRILSSTLTKPTTLAPSTLSDHMLLLLPSDSQAAQLSSSLNADVFATKTYLTTYTYLTTFYEDGTTRITSNEKVISNVVTEERSRTPLVTPTPALVISDSSDLATGVFQTTYTYLNTLHDGDIPLVVTSTHTVTNTVTAPEDYLLQLQPSESVGPDTNTYLSTVSFTKTLTDGLDTKVVSTEDVLTQVVITDSVQKSTELISPTGEPLHTRPIQGSFTDVIKTYFVTYTYYSTLLDGDNTVVQSTVAISSDVVTEKVFIGPKRTSFNSNTNPSEPHVEVTPTQMPFSSEKPIQLYATKTYLTTFTYFTTLLQDIGNDQTSTVVQSQTRVVSNVVTETVPVTLLSSDYVSSLRLSLEADSVSSFVTLATLSDGHEVTVTAIQDDTFSIQPTSTFETPITTSYVDIQPSLSSSMDDQSNNHNDIVSGSTIIFFDENDQIDSSTKPTPALGTIQSTFTSLLVTTSSFEDISLVAASSTAAASETFADPIVSPSNIFTSILTSSTVASNGATLKPGDEVIMMTQSSGNITMIPVSDPANKKPNVGLLERPGGSEIEVSDLLSLGSLGINSLNALGPVINAMAGLINGNIHPSAKRRNDTLPNDFFSTHTKPIQPNDERPHPVYVPDKNHAVRSPIYIPVGGIAADINDKNDDIATAESLRFEGHVNLNQDKRGSIKWINPDSDYSDTHQRHRTTDVIHGHLHMENPILSDGIPISPGEVINTNSDIIIGKHGAVGPRPPKLSDTVDDVPLGMKPPPPPFQPMRNNHHAKPIRDNEPLGLKIYENIHHPPPPIPLPEGDKLLPSSHNDHLLVLDHKTESSSNVLHHLNHYNNEIIHGSPLQNNYIIPAPANIPVIDRSTGQSLLVNIQPSQVANVVIQNPSANMYGSGYGSNNVAFHDNSPIPLPENSPGFIGIGSNTQQGESEDHNRIHSHVSIDNNIQNSNGFKVDIVPGQGINIDVVPGQNMNVEIVPDHLSQNSVIKIPNGHISPNGIVLDEPLQNRPQHSNINPQKHQAHYGSVPMSRYPSGFTLHHPTTPANFINHHHQQKFPLHQRPSNHINSVPRPMDFMVPPPPPHFHHGMKTPIPIPISETRLKLPVDIPENLLPHSGEMLDKGNNGGHIETEEGEVIQESVRRPLRPGQLPIDNHASPTLRPHIGSSANNEESIMSEEDSVENKEIISHTEKPTRLNLDFPVHHHNSINFHHRPHHSNKPLINFDEKPPINTYNPPIKPQIHYSGSSEFTDHVIHKPSSAEKPSSFQSNKRPHISKFDPSSEEYDDSMSSYENDGIIPTTNRPKLADFDLQVQMSSPRPFTALPTSQQNLGANVITHKPIIHTNTTPKEEIVMGLKPPPPPNNKVNIGQRPVGINSNNKPFQTNLNIQQPTQFSMSNNENKKYTTIVIPNKNQIPSTTPPYEFETPTPPPIRDISVAESTGKPVWSQPALHEIPSPTNVSQQKPHKHPSEDQKFNRTTVQEEKPNRQSADKNKPNIQQFQQQRPTRLPIEPQRPSRLPIETQRPTRLPVEIQRPSRPPIETQRPSRPPVETQRPSRPTVETQRPSRPTIETQRPSRPPIEQQSPTRPAIEMQRPSVQQNKPTRPSLQQQKPSLQIVQQSTLNVQPIEKPRPSQQPTPQTIPSVSTQQTKPSLESPYQQKPNIKPLPQEKPEKPSTENFSRTRKPPVSQSTISFSRPVITTPSWIPTDNNEPLQAQHVPVVPTRDISSSKHISSPVIQESSTSSIKLIHLSKPITPSSSLNVENLQTVVRHPIKQENAISIISIKPTSTEHSKIHKSSLVVDTNDVIVGSETIYPEFSHLATPSVETNSRKDSTKVTSPFVTSKSKTIFGPPHFTRSVSQVKSSNLLITSVTRKPSYQSKLPDKYGGYTDSEEEDEESMSHKTDLGVASSNNERIVFGNIDYTPQVTPKLPTQYVTHTETLTVTTTETTVISSIGHLPSTKTVVLTKTQTSTRVDTVTQIHTLVKPTSVTATVTTTVSATVSQYPHSYNTIKRISNSHLTRVETKIQESPVPSTRFVTPTPTVDKTKINKNTATIHDDDNDSFFVIVNDQKPGTVHITNAHGGKDQIDGSSDVSHKDPNQRINHGVFLGGVLVAPSPSQESVNENNVANRPFATACKPECSATRNELCQRVQGEMKCVCRPGFARIFSDRPCKPTYTYSLRMPLIRHGKEELRYETSLVDSNSPHYHQVSESTREALDRMVMQSDLRDIYHGVAIDSFQPSMKENGIMVSFYVQLSDNTEETRLKDVFKKSLRTSNYSLGGTDMYADKDLLQYIEAEDFDECQNSKFHDCSENARCFNLRGTYTCSCKEGYTDLSENAAFPGRLCSAELIGCDKCHYHGTCYSRGDEQVVCECFQWYAGDYCQINLKVLLIALVTIGALLLALLLVCIVLTCLKRNRNNVAQVTRPAAPRFLRYRGTQPRAQTLDKRAMIQDSSSEGSVENVPVAYMTPTPQELSSIQNTHREVKTMSMEIGEEESICSPEITSDSNKSPDIPSDSSKSPEISSDSSKSPDITSDSNKSPEDSDSLNKSPELKKPTNFSSKLKKQSGVKKVTTVDSNSDTLKSVGYADQRDRSLTVMIPRAKYRPVPPLSPILTMSTFGAPEKRAIAQEQKLLCYLENGGKQDKNGKSNGHKKHSAPTHPKPTESSPPRKASPPRKQSPGVSGALVSAGFEVSATVGRKEPDGTTADVHVNTLASNGSHFTTLRTENSTKEGVDEKKDTKQNATIIQIEPTVSEARSCDETTIHPPTKSLHNNYGHKGSSHTHTHDEGHTMAERDVGSTLLMPHQTHLYNADRSSDISNFDSL